MPEKVGEYLSDGNISKRKVDFREKESQAWLSEKLGKHSNTLPLQDGTPARTSFRHCADSSFLRG